VTAIVAVLAGGRGRRMGRPKALVELDGRPLISYPLAAAAQAGLDAVVVAKAGTNLPELDVPVWREPDEPVHPLLGIVTAVEQADGPVVAVACDQPFVTPELLQRLATGPEAAVRVGDRLEPLPARYEPAALPALRAALDSESSLRRTLASLAPVEMECEASLVASVNTPEELKAAQRG
jgi:molybdopterin-guanine dinucleotide biosynthesis protein A